MKLYRKLVPKIARDVVRTLRHDRDIDVEDTKIDEAELDVAAVFVRHLNLLEQVTTEAETAVARHGLGVERYGPVKRGIAKQLGIKLGDEGDEDLVNGVIEVLFETPHVSEVFAEDNDLRKKIYEIVKKYAGIDADLDRQVRGRLKNLREGTQEWDIEYTRHISSLRHFSSPE